MATYVLVFRPPGGLHRDHTGHRDYVSHTGVYGAQTAARGQPGSGRLHGRDRLFELHGLGSSHVYQWYEPLLVAAFLGADADHHNSGIHHLFELDSHGFRSAAAFPYAGTICHRVHFCVRDGRAERLLPGATIARYLPPRDLFRGGPFPHGDGSRGNIWHVRGNVFLVSQDVRANDERNYGEDSFLGDFHGRLFHLYTNALHWAGPKRPAVFSFCGRLSDTADSGAQIHHHRGIRHGSGAASLSVQPFLEHVPWQEGGGKPLGFDDAGVDDSIAAAIRQLWRPASNCVPRSVRAWS